MSLEPTSQKTGVKHTGYDINRRIVAAATSSSMGYNQTKIFFSLTGLPPPMSEKMWYCFKDNLHSEVTDVADEHLQEAAQSVRCAYADKGLGLTDDDGVLDVIVSIDGSWQKGVIRLTTVW